PLVAHALRRAVRRRGPARGLAARAGVVLVPPPRRVRRAAAVGPLGWTPTSVGLGAWAYARGVSRSRAAFGSVLFLLVAPGVVAGLGPWLLTGWRSSNPATAVVLLGSALLVLGIGVLLHAFGRFVFEG